MAIPPIPPLNFSGSSTAVSGAPVSISSPFTAGNINYNSSGASALAQSITPMMALVILGAIVLYKGKI